MTSRGEQDGSWRTREGGRRRPGPVRSGLGRFRAVWTGLGCPGPVWTVVGRFGRSGPVLDWLDGPGVLDRSGSGRSGPAWTGCGLGEGLDRPGWGRPGRLDPTRGEPDQGGLARAGSGWPQLTWAVRSGSAGSDRFEGAGGGRSGVADSR